MDDTIARLAKLDEAEKALVKVRRREVLAEERVEFWTGAKELGDFWLLVFGFFGDVFEGFLWFSCFWGDVWAFLRGRFGESLDDFFWGGRQILEGK